MKIGSDVPEVTWTELRCVLRLGIARPSTRPSAIARMIHTGRNRRESRDVQRPVRRAPPPQVAVWRTPRSPTTSARAAPIDQQHEASPLRPPRLRAGSCSTPTRLGRPSAVGRKASRCPTEPCRSPTAHRRGRPPTPVLDRVATRGLLLQRRRQTSPVSRACAAVTSSSRAPRRRDG